MNFKLETSAEERVPDSRIHKVVTFEDCQIITRNFVEENMEKTSSRNQFVAALTSEYTCDFL